MVWLLSHSQDVNLPISLSTSHGLPVLVDAPPPSTSGGGWQVEGDAAPNAVWIGKTLTIRCGAGQHNPDGPDFSTITYTASGWERDDPGFVCGKYGLLCTFSRMFIVVFLCVCGMEIYDDLTRWIYNLMVCVQPDGNTNHRFVSSIMIFILYRRFPLRIIIHFLIFPFLPFSFQHLYHKLKIKFPFPFSVCHV